MSLVPPALLAVITLIGLVGKACARTTEGIEEAIVTTAATTIANLFT